MEKNKKDAVIKTLRHFCVLNARGCDHSLSENAAIRLLDIHLDEKNFPMARHSRIQERSLLAYARENANVPTIDTEKTKSLEGLLRVLMRTRLNSQGVGRVTQGAEYKTQAPRVMRFFDGVDDAEILSWLNWEIYINRWYMTVKSAGEDDKKGRVAIDKMRKLTQQEVLFSKTAILDVGDTNWWRVVRGFFSGLHYLHAKYLLNPINLWGELDSILLLTSADQAIKVLDLTKEFSTNVHEYGDALAGSFYSDLGCPSFVKNDTHVSSVTAAINKSTHAAAAFTESLQMCFGLASHCGCSPRAIDKLMFFAAGGGYYLAGLKMDRHTSSSHKENLLSELRRL
jgi:hypothetical protein